MEAEFIEEVRDILNGIEVLIGNLRSRSVPAADGLARIRRDMVNVAARGSTLDQPMVTIIAHRLGEYLDDGGDLDGRRLDDVLSFLDQIRRALDNPHDASTKDAAKIVRALPARVTSDFNPADVKITNIEILLVIPDKATSRIVERELHACGYRVSNVRSPFQALEMVVRTQPDMAIVSSVMDELSGVDVAAALSAMPTTRSLPVAILTSFSWGHPSLQDLPSRVPIIRKGANFGDDLADALARLRIT
jgi:CheY-like chemotaxis protein